MLVKCINPRLNHIVFGNDGNGKRQPHRVRVGETFEVKSIPAIWEGYVVAVEGGGNKAKITNPKESEELVGLRAEYKEASGKSAHWSWDEEAIKAKLVELAED